MLEGIISDFSSKFYSSHLTHSFTVVGILILNNARNSLNNFIIHADAKLTSITKYTTRNMQIFTSNNIYTSNNQDIIRVKVSIIKTTTDFQ